MGNSGSSKTGAGKVSSDSDKYLTPPSSPSLSSNSCNSSQEKHCKKKEKNFPKVNYKLKPSSSLSSVVRAKLSKTPRGRVKEQLREVSSAPSSQCSSPNLSSKLSEKGGTLVSSRGSSLGGSGYVFFVLPPTHTSSSSSTNDPCTAIKHIEPKEAEKPSGSRAKPCRIPRPSASSDNPSGVPFFTAAGHSPLSYGLQKSATEGVICSASLAEQIPRKVAFPEFPEKSNTRTCVLSAEEAQDVSNVNVACSATQSIKKANTGPTCEVPEPSQLLHGE